MTNLPPAYRGAPYYQPGPPPPRQRFLRLAVVVAILAAVLALIIVTFIGISVGMN